MDLLFAVSKIAGALLLPTNLIVLAGLAAVGLCVAPRTRRYGVRLGLGAGCALLVLAILPVGPLMLRQLERQFPSLETCPSLLDQPVSGIILLGGGVGSTRVEGRVTDDLNDASDRLWLAARLARQLPGAPLVLSGGQAFDNGTDRPEADATVAFLEALGVARTQMVLERSSRTTAENAEQASILAGKGNWVIVTSAFHMPRAVGAFRSAGLSVIPAPVDWRIADEVALLPIDPIANLSILNTATKEYIGLAGYWLTGRSRELFPGSGNQGCSDPALRPRRE